jgi:hypothetical protein
VTGEGSRSGRIVIGELVVVEEERAEASESVLDWRERRRKGMEGRRNVGKRVGIGCGSEGLRRKDIVIFRKPLGMKNGLDAIAIRMDVKKIQLGKETIYGQSKGIDSMRYGCAGWLVPRPKRGFGGLKMMSACAMIKMETMMHQAPRNW